MPSRNRATRHSSYRAQVAQMEEYERQIQIRMDREMAQRLQAQEGLPAAASMGSANIRRSPSPQVPFEPPVVLSEYDSDEQEQGDTGITVNSPVIPTSPVLDRNGAYTPEPYESRSLPRRASPVIDRNGAYTPEPYQSRSLPRRSVPTSPVPDRNGTDTSEASQRRFPPQGFAPVIPPVVPPSNALPRGILRPSRPSQSAPVIPPAPPTLPVHGRNPSGPHQPPQPRQPVPVIPPVVPNPYPAPNQPRQPAPVIPPVVPGAYPAGFRRANTPAPPRMYEPWYPPGVVPHHLYPQTTTPMVSVPYYPQPPHVVPAPPIPPIFYPQKPIVVSPPPPKQTEEPTVPFIPPMPDEQPTPKPSPRPVLKPKPKSAVKKPAVSSETDDIQNSAKTESNSDTSSPRARRKRSRTRAVPAPPPPEAEEKTESSEDSGSNTLVEEDEITDNDVDLETGPLHDLRKHVNLLAGSFKCSTCFAVMHPKPIHKHLGTSPSLPSFDSHLHLMCSECHALHCRGCHVTSCCRRTCNAGPDEKCLLKTCCRAGRAVAIFAILSCFDAKFLAMSGSPHFTRVEYVKNAISSSSTTSSLSDLLCTTIKSLLAWLPIDPIHSKSMPHVHRSVEPLFRVSVLLQVIRVYLHAPLERWVRRRNAEVYEQILVFLRRLEKVGKGAIAGLVLKPGRGIKRTHGIGEVVCALAKIEKHKGIPTKKKLGWTAGNEHESFSETLGKKKLRQDLQDLKDKIHKDQKEKKELLDQFLCQLLSWSMADVLKN